MTEKQYIQVQEENIWRKKHQPTVTFLKGEISALHVNHLHFYKTYGSLLLSAEISIK